LKQLEEILHWIVFKGQCRTVWVLDGELTSADSRSSGSTDNQVLFCQSYKGIMNKGWKSWLSCEFRACGVGCF